MPTAYEIGWLAGLIEGEGTISVELKRRGDSVYASPYLQVVNTNKEIVEKVLSIIGNSAKIYKTYHKGSKRPAWQIKIYRRSGLKKVLEMIKPHVTETTRKKIELICELIDLQDRNKRYTKEEKEKVVELVHKIQELNKKGKTPVREVKFSDNNEFKEALKHWDKEAKEIIELAKQGFTAKEIAERLGLTRQQVYNRLYNRGYKFSDFQDNPYLNSAYRRRAKEDRWEKRNKKIKEQREQQG